MVVDDKFFQARVTKRVDFAPDLWMFRIEAGGAFNFVPGQYATLGVEDGGKRIERPYSIASSPSESAHAPALQTPAGRQITDAQGAQGKVRTRNRKRTHESFAGVYGYGRGPVRQLHPHAVERLEGRAI